MKQLTLILWNIRSTYNVGAILRTCDGFGVERIVLSGYTPFFDKGLPHEQEKLRKQIHKTALGAEDSVTWKYFDTALEAVETLKAEGYEVYSVEQAHGSTMLQNFTPINNKKYAVVLGNEVKGVHQEVIDASDGCLEIPQFGTKHSMNVSVTGGIIIWHFAKNIIL